MPRSSENMPPDIGAIFDTPGGEWSLEECQRVLLWLHEGPQIQRLQDTARTHLPHPHAVQTTDIATQVVQDYLDRRFDKVRKRYDPFHKEITIQQVRDGGRLLDTLLQPPEALATFLREHLQAGTRQLLAQWPTLRDAVFVT